MSRSTIGLLLLSVILVEAAWNPPPVGGQSVEASGQALTLFSNSLKKAIDASIVVAASSEGSTVRADLDRIAASAKTIQDTWSAKPKGLPNDYVDLLKDYAGFLERLAKPADGEKRNLELLKPIADDLAIKSHAASARTGDSALMLTEVEVTVETVDVSKHVVAGLRVRANPIWTPDKDPPKHIFDQLSSPTTHAMPPGRYSFSAVDEKSNVVATEVHDIGAGEKPESKEKIQLLIGAGVPAGAH